jgi:hypothetical protein
VCRPGGRIGLANWTPDSFVGGIFKIVGRHVPPPAGIRSPLEWGSRARLDELFSGNDFTIDAREREFVFRYRSAENWLDTFRDYYGPTHKAFAALDDAERATLARELLALAEQHNTSITGALRVPSPYLEAVVTRTTGAG